MGKTIQPLANRLRAHILHADRPYGKKTYCRNWIRSLAGEGLRPAAIVLMDVPAGGDWVHWERFWIAWFRDIEPKMTNHCDGGEGAPRRLVGHMTMCWWCGKGYTAGPTRHQPRERFAQRRAATPRVPMTPSMMAGERRGVRVRPGLVIGAAGECISAPKKVAGSFAQAAHLSVAEKFANIARPRAGATASIHITEIG